MWMYQYRDYTTSLTRAIAWFSDESWPRNGTELDNFLENRPFKQMQGSHRYHKHLCLVHLVYESSEINEDRKECHLRAKFRRQEGLDIREECDRHRPPCLMQHAATTTLEAFLLQFDVLSTAKGKGTLARPAIKIPERPHWHPYPTFETQLPVTFCRNNTGIALHPKDLVTGIQSPRHLRKPDLRCQFCPRIKAYQSIIALWPHLVREHSISGKEENFNGSTVLSWKLY